MACRHTEDSTPHRRQQNRVVLRMRVGRSRQVVEEELVYEPLDVASRISPGFFEQPDYLARARSPVVGVFLVLRIAQRLAEVLLVNPHHF